MTIPDQSHRNTRQPAGRQFFAMAAIAQQLDVSPRTVHRLIKSGELVAHRFGGSVRVSEVDLKQFLVARRDAD
jgi:excisionase family DNA binding protein